MRMLRRMRSKMESAMALLSEQIVIHQATPNPLALLAVVAILLVHEQSPQR